METEPGLIVRLDVASPVVHDVDVVAVCITAGGRGNELRGAVEKLDRLLGGAVTDLRAGKPPLEPGGVATLASAAGIRARHVLLIWLGSPEQVDPSALERAAVAAVTNAVALGAGSLGFAPGLRDQGVISLEVGAIATAVARGAKRGVAQLNLERGRSLVFALEVSEANRQLAEKGLSST